MADSIRQRARRVFMELADLPPEAQAAALHTASAGDEQLRAEVRALLNAEARTVDFMATPTRDALRMSAAEAATFAAPIREGPGTLIGPYKILQAIGEGGFGSVFMAEQREPVKRQVALKIIKLGMDTAQVVARFEQERQALAMMDHPNIAKVLDAGATETGRPFFVMELVKGDPIVEYADKNNLSVEDRLELFVQVCLAVQHAHTKGIIHRDIKPSNILVSTQDGKPHTKVIDFGIAKATASKLTDKTLFTEHKAFIGTPEYMSPEQAEGSLDIDTRSDVYSLGVLLYELLTGTTPFSSKELRSAAYAEIQRIIREVEPPKPSTRISTNTDTIAKVASQRHTEPKRLGATIRGELDWIVMKALEKDRQRRYETANGLGMDVRRYLSGEAVLAAPPSNTYRLRKFVRRHKSGVLAGGLIAAALILGLAGTIWQATVATKQRDTAQREATRAVTAEADARRRADEVQKVADFQGQMLAQVDPTIAGMRLTEDIRTRFTKTLAKDSVPDDQRSAQVEAFIAQWSRVNATDTARELIDRTILKPAAEAIDKQFTDQPAVAATLRNVLAERYHDLGLDAAALALGERALAERRRIFGDDHDLTITSITNTGILLNALGKTDEAERFYREAVERSRRVRGPEHADTLTTISNLGVLLLNKDKLADAEVLLKEALDGRRRTLGDDAPDTISSLGNWATLLQEQGKLAEAETHMREAVDKARRLLGEDHVSTLSEINNLAALLDLRGKTPESTALMRELVDRKRRTLGETHPATLRSIQGLGAFLFKTDQSAEAEALLREALDKQRTLLGADHTSTITSQHNFGTYLINQGKFAEAEPLCRDTLERSKRVFGENHSKTLISTNVMGLVLVRQGRPAEGEQYWRSAMETSRRIVGPAHHETLTYTQNLGALCIDQKKYDEAERLLRQVLELGRPELGGEHPIILSATGRLAACLLATQQYAALVDLLAAAEAPMRKVYTGPNAHNLAQQLKNLARARAGLNQFPAAEANFLESHAMFVTARGDAHKSTRDCAQSIVDFYTAWDKAEPGKGYDAKAAAWRDRLQAVRSEDGEQAKPNAK